MHTPKFNKVEFDARATLRTDSKTKPAPTTPAALAARVEQLEKIVGIKPVA
jgi:hypothetical protein